MSQLEADRLRLQVEHMAWAQHLAQWEWLTLALWAKMAKGAVYND